MSNLEEIEKFESENGVPYVDLFAGEQNDSIQGTGTSMDGKTMQDYAKSKGIGLAVADGVYGGIRSLVELAAIPVYKTTSKIMTGDWGDFEKDASEEFNQMMPEEVAPTTTGEGIAQGLAKFGTSTFIAGGVGKVAGLTGKGGAITDFTIKAWSKSKDGLQVGKILAPALNGMIGDATAFWQDKENLSSILNEHSDNKYIKEISSWLAIDEDDDVADRMLKQSLEGLFTAGAVNGIFKTLKGIKDYGKAVIKSARLARTSKQFGEEIKQLTRAQRIAEVPETAEQIVDAVERGERIAPKNFEELKQQVKEVKKVKDLGIEIPRNPDRISVEQAKRSVAKRITDLGWGDAENLTTEQLNKLAKDAENQVEKVMPALQNEEDVFIGGLVKMKQAGKDFAEGQISKAERNQEFFKALGETANAFGATQDMLYESGKALGYASQNEAHKTIKDVLNAIIDNADELTQDKLFDIFSGAKTVEELRSKLMKLGYIDEKAFKKSFEQKARNAFAQVTALEQAGLMSNFGTVSRNIITSLEMGVENIVSKPFSAAVSGLKRGIFRNGSPVSGVEAKEAFATMGGYLDAIKDSAEWMFDKVIRKADVGESPWSIYRNSASRKAMTNLPKEVGETFKHGGPLSRAIEKYIQVSGVGVSEKIDNFFESVFYRGEARARAYEYAARMGREKKLTSKQIKELYNNTLDKVMGVDITQKKNLASVADEIMSDNLVELSIAKKAREGAAKATFRGSRGYITENVIGKTMDAWWFTRPFIPFFKTSSTIFLDRFIGDLTPLGVFSRSFWSAMKKGGREMDETIGKMVMGGGLLTYGYTLAIDGRITGDYSTDPAVRNSQIAAGWQPNSMVFENDDGTKRYISLDYLGPLSMCLKYPAKLLSAVQDYKNSLKFYEDEKFMDKMSVIASAFIADAMDEVALRYFADGISLFRGNKPDEILARFGEGALKLPLKFVPREISEAAPMFTNPDQIKQMLDGIGDEVKKTFGVPTNDVYDVFGEQVLDKSPFYGILGIKTKKVEEEKWLENLADLGIGFEMPKKSITRDKIPLDLTPTQANNIRKEMGELNVKQALKDTCSTKTFMGLSKDLQKDIAKTIFNQYREAAIQRYYLKDTDLQEQFKDRIKSISKKYVPTMRVE